MRGPSKWHWMKSLRSWMVGCANSNALLLWIGRSSRPWKKTQPWQKKAHSPSKEDIMVSSDHNIRKLAPTSGWWVTVLVRIASLLKQWGILLANSKMSPVAYTKWMQAPGALLLMLSWLNRAHFGLDLSGRSEGSSCALTQDCINLSWCLYDEISVAILSDMSCFMNCILSCSACNSSLITDMHRPPACLSSLHKLSWLCWYCSSAQPLTAQSTSSLGCDTRQHCFSPSINHFMKSQWYALDATKTYGAGDLSINPMGLWGGVIWG